MISVSRYGCRSALTRSGAARKGYAHNLLPLRTFVDVPSAIQAAITAVHTDLGLPWWASFAATTVVVRASMLPLMRSQLIASSKLSKAMPEISMLVKLLQNRVLVMKKSPLSDRMRVFNVFSEGVKACLVLHDVQMRKIISYPLINLSVFVTFVYSLRRMIISPDASYDLENGGLLMFQDLTISDPSFALPFAAVTLSYTAIEYAFSHNPDNKTTLMLKDGIQCLLLLGVPFVTTLPSGVFFYWIPSSIFGMAQTYMLRNPSVQRILNIPAPGQPPVQSSTVVTRQHDKN